MSIYDSEAFQMEQESAFGGVDSPLSSRYSQGMELNNVKAMRGPSLERGTCRYCGTTFVAWAKSKRTGRSYLCEIAGVGSDERAMPYRPHKCKER